MITYCIRTARDSFLTTDESRIQNKVSINSLIFAIIILPNRFESIKWFKQNYIYIIVKMLNKEKIIGLVWVVNWQAS